MMLACPACGRLVHADRLASLAADAESADARGDMDAALPLWREALDLLPAGSRQREVVTQRVNALSDAVRKRPGGGKPPPPAPGQSHTHGHRGLKGAAVAVGGLALLLWKFKFVVAFLVTKGKLLLLGLTKSSTLFSMLLSVGVYWTVWGWRFALGIVLAIYVHEMGHVITLSRYGFKASAPTFIPGLGAFIRMKQRPVNPHEDAAVGLAGPIYGMLASAAAYALFRATDQPIFGAIAQFNAWINLFNLIPIGPLDGGRAFGALSRKQRWWVVLAMLTAWVLTAENLLALLALVAGFRAAAEKPATDEGDKPATVQFVGLIGLLSWMCLIPVPVPR